MYARQYEITHRPLTYSSTSVFVCDLTCDSNSLQCLFMYEHRFHSASYRCSKLFTLSLLILTVQSSTFSTNYQRSFVVYRIFLQDQNW
ncbi:hypothetical protein O181_020482 [Austropuccinia psidii MF-1]|uniref:Uncharacterized protein n=1 Tax=Austropuccinia psidii MF-1 TaxID=1389203 RepID=A0A9Q3CDK3_9BASI|nr:hypothetical protein [Austropuccinia psidii MF-1]